jgi:hypothetical protein
VATLCDPNHESSFFEPIKQLRHGLQGEREYFTVEAFVDWRHHYDPNFSPAVIAVLYLAGQGEMIYFSYEKL